MCHVNKFILETRRNSSIANNGTYVLLFVYALQLIASA